MENTQNISSTQSNENPINDSQKNIAQNSSNEVTKPVKPEDKPFQDFIQEHLIPEIKTALKHRNIVPKNISLTSGPRPVVGGECWMICCEFTEGRRFWITFESENIKSTKNIILSESTEEGSLLESFLIDEKKITRKLITSRLLQRLNGQKWLGDN